jgi:hypothetical protein
MHKTFYIVALVVLAVALPALTVPYNGRAQHIPFGDDNKKCKGNCNSNGKDVAGFAVVRPRATFFEA